MDRNEYGTRQQWRAAERASRKAGRPAPFRGHRVPSDATTQADEAFHHRFPARTIRMRVASRSEVERMEARRVSSGVLPGPTGWRWFTLVMYDARGPIARQFLMAPSDADCDLSEVEALAMWHGGDWPTGQVDAAMALQRALAQGDHHIRIRLPIGPEAYPDAAAAIDDAHAQAEVLGLPPPTVVECRSGLHALWPVRVPALDPLGLASLHAVQAAGIEVVDAATLLAEMLPEAPSEGAP